MKGIKYVTYLAFWVIGYFTAAMLITYFSDYLQTCGFFGDVKLSAPERSNDGLNIDVWYTWGPRHYWYYWMCFVLFILAIVRTVFWSIYYWETPTK